MKNRIFVIAICIWIVNTTAFALELGQKPVTVELKGETGGKVNGGDWTSEEIKERVTVLFYVDPDEKDLNNELADALKKENFSDDVYQSIAIINMDATWAPNFAIESKLKDKQKEFPRTIYVKDKDKVLVKKWGLGDDNNVFVLFDRDGKVLYHRDGKVGSDEVKKVIETIKSKIAK